MYNRFLFIVAAFFCFVFSGVGGAQISPTEFFYATTPEIRLYAYPQGSSFKLEKYTDTFVVSPSTLTGTFQDRDFFLSPLKRYENSRYQLLLGSGLHHVLLDRTTDQAVADYAFKKQGSSLALILPQQSAQQLAEVIDGVKLDQRTATKGTYPLLSRSVDLGRVRLDYQNNLQTDTLSAEPVGWDRPERATDVFSLQLDTLNFWVEHTDQQNDYIFIVSGNHYVQTSRFPIRDQTGVTLNRFLQVANRYYRLEARSTADMAWYYFLHEKDNAKPASIADTDILAMLFPVAPAPPVLDSSVIGREGVLTPSQIAFEREQRYGFSAWVTQNTTVLSGKYFFAYVTLNNTPYPHPSRAYGRMYSGQFFEPEEHFSDQHVGLYVPSKFNPRLPMDYLVYFHGWNNSVLKVMQMETLAAQIERSGRNVILVVPELSVNAQDSSGGALDDRDGFKHMMASVSAYLAPLLPCDPTMLDHAKYMIAAHSGGYVAMANSLMWGGLPIRAAFLFDGLYGHRDRFLLWKQRNPEANLTILFTDSGGTSRDVQDLLTTLGGFGLADRLFQVDLPQPQSTPALIRQLKQSRISLIDTGNTSHHQIVSKGYLELLLKSLE